MLSARQNDKVTLCSAVHDIHIVDVRQLYVTKFLMNSNTCFYVCSFCFVLVICHFKKVMLSHNLHSLTKSRPHDCTVWTTTACTSPITTAHIPRTPNTTSRLLTIETRPHSLQFLLNIQRCTFYFL